MPGAAVAAQRLQRLGQKLLFDPSYYWHTTLFLLLGDALLTQVIIRFVKCAMPALLVPTEHVNERVFTDTEIDWVTYMHHIELYLSGERNYSLIDGPTGALV